jgi:hypothetical protein
LHRPCERRAAQIARAEALARNGIDRGQQRGGDRLDVG